MDEDDQIRMEEDYIEQFLMDKQNQ